MTSKFTDNVISLTTIFQTNTTASNNWRNSYYSDDISYVANYFTSSLNNCFKSFTNYQINGSDLGLSLCPVVQIYTTDSYSITIPSGAKYMNIISIGGGGGGGGGGFMNNTPNSQNIQGGGGNGGNSGNISVTSFLGIVSSYTYSAYIGVGGTGGSGGQINSSRPNGGTGGGNGAATYLRAYTGSTNNRYYCKALGGNGGIGGVGNTLTFNTQQNAVQSNIGTDSATVSGNSYNYNKLGIRSECAPNRTTNPSNEGSPVPPTSEAGSIDVTKYNFGTIGGIPPYTDLINSNTLYDKSNSYTFNDYGRGGQGGCGAQVQASGGTQLSEISSYTKGKAGKPGLLCIYFYFTSIPSGVTPSITYNTVP